MEVSWLQALIIVTSTKTNVSYPYILKYSNVATEIIGLAEAQWTYE